MYFTFERPEFLWLLFAIPLFIISHFYFLKKSRSKAMKFANFEALKRVSGDKFLTKNMTHLFLRVALVFFLIVAASGATFWYRGMVSEVDFVIALDSSPSMTSQDVFPSRFDEAKRIASDFIGSLGTRTSIGLVSYSGVSFVKSPLTESRLEIREALRSSEVMRSGGTDMPGAIITSTNLLAGSERSKAILIISDGITTIDVFVGGSVREALTYARNNNVVIYTIGIGTDSGPVGFLPEYYNITIGFNEEILEFIAEETGGFYLYSPSATELEEAFNFIEGDAFEAYVDLELFFPALLVVLILVFLEWGLANTLFRRVV